MALFRKHRGLLEDSLKTTVLINSLSDLMNYIKNDLKCWGDAINYDFKIKVEPYGGLDERCGWYTHIVSIDLTEKEKFVVIGFLSENLL